uniref:Uncharacterized protein n=1 Tax=Knipowitschia caucasica TaxID=637954 RepID=A0AAV2JA90_KNICA
MYHLGFTKCHQGLRYRRNKAKLEAAKPLSDSVIPYVHGYNYYGGHTAPEPYAPGTKYNLQEPSSAYSPYNSKAVYKQNRDNLAVEKRSKTEDDRYERKQSNAGIELLLQQEQQRRNNSVSSKPSTIKSRMDDLQI